MMTCMSRLFSVVSSQKNKFCRRFVALPLEGPAAHRKHFHHMQTQTSKCRTKWNAPLLTAPCALSNKKIHDIWIMKRLTTHAVRPMTATLPPPWKSCRALQRRGPEVNTLEGRMERESSTKDVCNAIRMNKGLFNEEASLPLMFPLPIQLFNHCEWEVRAAGPQSWVYWKVGLAGSKHNQISCQEDFFFFFLFFLKLFIM